MVLWICCSYLSSIFSFNMLISVPFPLPPLLLIWLYWSYQVSKLVHLEGEPKEISVLIVCVNVLHVWLPDGMALDFFFQATILLLVLLWGVRGWGDEGVRGWGDEGMRGWGRRWMTYHAEGMLWEVLPLSKPPSPRGSHWRHRPAPPRLGEREPSLHCGEASWGMGEQKGGVSFSIVYTALMQTTKYATCKQTINSIYSRIPALSVCAIMPTQHYYKGL